MEVIDLRSDTVTEPTAEMRASMAEATVGDDVYGEDPTVNRLEQDAAEMFGMEAGLFVSSGSQGNLIALLTHCDIGDEVILGNRSHIFLFEQGGLSAVGGLVPHTLPVQDDGTLNLNDIKAAVRDNDDHFPCTRLICLENTQGSSGGVPLPLDYTQSVVRLAHHHGLKVHVDGARIFNAATSLKRSVSEVVAGVDSISFCLSKGLGAPVGSVVLGTRDFIRQARRKRKLLGGGMRQAGVLAAPGLIALHRMSTRLQEDHDHAAYLAEKLSRIEELRVLSQHTNFVFFALRDSAKIDAQQLAEELKKKKILISPYHGSTDTFRLVLHHWITKERVDAFVEGIEGALR